MRGDHARQPPQGGDEDVEAVLGGVLLGFDEELDAFFEDGDGVGEVEGVEAQRDLVLLVSCLGQEGAEVAVGARVLVARLRARLTLGRA
jgi:hypothetical protein